ncbi:hypothetical protein GW17_00031645 [Ensete ventricosum]|nr:hypothetical protein GW17_00031645 [Ensete ventricosum]
MRSCAQLLACGGVGLVPSGGSGTGWTERSSGVDLIEQGLGNSIGAGIDPTEWELWNLNGVGADPTERGSGTELAEFEYPKAGWPSRAARKLGWSSSDARVLDLSSIATQVCEWLSTTVRAHNLPEA